MDLTTLYSKSRGGAALENLTEAELSTLTSLLSSDLPRLSDLKRSLDHRQDQQASQHETALRQRLSSLDSALAHQTALAQQTSTKLDQLRDQVALDELALETQVKRELWELQRDREVEELARLRLAAEKVCERRSVVEGVVRRRAAELEAIAEESARRKRSNQEVLEEILARTDVLQGEILGHAGAYDANVRQDLAATLLRSVEEEGEGEGAESRHYHRLVDQVEVIRSKRRKQEKTLRDKEVQALNERRVEIEAQEEEVKERRRQQRFLESKGVEFLAEVEFGNAPPLEYLLSNAEEAELKKCEQQAEKDPEQLLPLPALVRKVEQRVKDHKDMRRRLEEELQEIDSQRAWCASALAQQSDEPWYDGSLGESSYPTEKLPIYRLARELVSDLVEEFLDSPVLDYSRRKTEALRQHEKWELTRKLLREREANKLERAVIQESCTAMVDRVVGSLIIGVHEEIRTAHDFAWKKAQRMVLSALLSGNAHEKHSANLVQIFQEVHQQRQRKLNAVASKKKSRIAPTYHSSSFSISSKVQDMSELYVNDAIISRFIQREAKTDDSFQLKLTPAMLAKGIDPSQMLASSKTRHRPSLVQNHKEGTFEVVPMDVGAEAHFAEDDDEEFAEVLSFRQAPVHEPYHLSKPQLQKEASFWKGIQFNLASMVYEPKVYGKITAVAGSANGSYLAVGTNKQCLQVWDLRYSPKPMLVRRWMSHGAAHKGGSGIAAIQFSFDCGSRLLCLTEDGKVMLFQTNPSRQAKHEQMAPELGKFKPLDMHRLLTLTWKDFYRTEREAPEEPDKKKKRKKKKQAARPGAASAEEELRPVHASFFCSHSLMGVPLALLIGLKNGTIVKWNAHDDEARGERQVFAPCHAMIEATNSMTGTFEGLPRKPRHYFGSTILREFFHAHTTSIIFAGFAKRLSEVLFTVDEKLCMVQWTYEPKAFSSFGWYLPMRRYKLDFSILSFQADEAYEQEIIFPPPDYSVPSRPELDDSYLHLIQEQLHDLAMQQLNTVPWSSQYLSEEGHRLYIYAPEDISQEHSAPHQVLVYSASSLLLKRSQQWFKPTVVTGELLQVELTPDGNDVVFMVKYPRPGVQSEVLLRFYIYSTVNMEMEPVSVGFAMPRNAPAVFKLCPVLEKVNCDNVYLLVDNVLYVISLASGGVVKEIHPNEDAHEHSKFTMLHVANDHRHVILGSESQSELVVYAVEETTG